MRNVDLGKEFLCWQRYRYLRTAGVFNVKWPLVLKLVDEFLQSVSPLLGALIFGFYHYTENSFLFLNMPYHCEEFGTGVNRGNFDANH